MRGQPHVVGLAALALLALALVGCRASTSTGAIPPSPTATATPSSTTIPSPTAAPTAATPTAPPGSRVVTLADVEGSITMRVGERFLLDLGQNAFEPYDWQATPADRSIVSRVPNILTIRGSQGLYEAHKPGQTELVANGEATCRESQPPCAAPSRSFSVEITVEP